MDDKSADESPDSPTDPNDPNGSQQQSTPGNQQTGSLPIDIKQASGSKFGVIHARQSPDSDGLVMDSNGEPVPIDKIIKTANTMSSMLMAHKIALEDNFRLEPGMDMSGPMMSLSPIIGSSPSKGLTSDGRVQEPSLQSKVKNIVHEAYWDLFKEELISQTSERVEDRKYDISRQILADVKSKIFELLLPQHTRIKHEIDDKLDPQIIEQLSRVHSLDLIEYAQYILNVLSRLCAPVRDETVKELKETTEVVPLFKGIMELLEMMRLDFANFTLNRFKPHIKAHSQEYEREKFNEILEQQLSIGIDGLEYTKVWLARAVDKIDSIFGLSELVNEIKNVDLDQGELSSSMMASGTETSHSYSVTDKILKSGVVTKILNAAYCELLEWTPNTQKLYPETLLFDESTFKQLGEQYKVLVMTSSILLTTFAFVNRFKLHENSEFRVLIKSHVITLLTASYDEPTTPKPSKSDDIKLETIAAKLCDDVRQKLADSDRGQLDSFLDQSDMFRRQILDIQNSSNRVRELSKRRIMEFVETLLTLDVDHENKKFSSRMAPPVNIPLGLNCLSDELTLTMAHLVKLIRYNRRVFFQHYRDIIVDSVIKKLNK